MEISKIAMNRCSGGKLQLYQRCMQRIEGTPTDRVVNLVMLNFTHAKKIKEVHIAPHSQGEREQNTITLV
jgi:hypothetical protein